MTLVEATQAVAKAETARNQANSAFVTAQRNGESATAVKKLLTAARKARTKLVDANEELIKVKVADAMAGNGEAAKVTYKLAPRTKHAASRRASRRHREIWQVTVNA